MRNLGCEFVRYLFWGLGLVSMEEGIFLPTHLKVDTLDAVLICLYDMRYLGCEFILYLFWGLVRGGCFVV